MSDFPYSMSVGRMQQFVKEIPTMTVPDKVVTKFLEARGYKSTNDRTILPTLRFLNLIDDAGAPTSKWQLLRDRQNFGANFASIVREAYRDLFNTLEEAPARSEAELANYFRANTKSSDRMVSAMVSVFKMLCSLADFSDSSSPEPEAPQHSASPSAPGGERVVPLPRGQTSIETRANNEPLLPSGGPQVALNVQIHLPASADASFIDSVFRSLAHHVLGRQDSVKKEAKPRGAAKVEEAESEEATLPGF